MKHKKIISTLLTLLLTTTCAYAVKGTFSGKKGWVKSPGKKSYLVQCNPGERFSVIVHSDKDTNVYINYTTIVNGRRGGSQKANSVNKTRHTLSFTAPTSKPKNRAKYWEYEVVIMTGRGTLQTDFTVTIK